MIFLTDKEKKKSIFDGIRGNIPAGVRERIATDIKNFVKDARLVGDLLEFRYLIKDGIITYKDLEEKTYDELSLILQTYEIPLYEEYVINKHYEQQQNNSLKIK